MNNTINSLIACQSTTCTQMVGCSFQHLPSILMQILKKGNKNITITQMITTKQ